jgi:hypothetical protein
MFIAIKATGFTLLDVAQIQEVEDLLMWPSRCVTMTLMAYTVSTGFKFAVIDS